MQYNKLVRDLIPQIIIGKGENVKTHIADNEEYWVALKNKLQEEVFELIDAHDDKALLEELVDIQEVIYAILKHKGYSLDDLEKIRQEKREKRGGFDEKIILEETN